SLQLAVKKEYEILADTDPAITKIVCYNGANEMRTIADIHASIIACLEKLI
ncbi:MAG: thymidylate kinase, partial [Bacteroidetes bacterium]|nr:thymidylate kinase [Bacteroidota bacterium]